jgi:ribulose-5-phosphate 4-epimerase/fuculose-1-phosphate aldolase
VACLQDFEFLMLDQNACRFYQRIAYDRDYAGMALEATEGARVAALLSNGKSVLFMGNHGVIVTGPSVAQAFDELYYLEKAAELQVLAMSTGRPLSLIPNKVAAQTCAQWQAYPTRFSEMLLNELMAILDDEAPSYKT